MNLNDEQKWTTAIVIGGSIAGLFTARVLSEFYEQVLIVDKDEFPAQPADRLGTPQGFHPHRFTMRGKAITERFFPGYEDDLLALGAPSSFNKTVHQMNQYGSIVMQYPRNDVKFSRAALEWVIRQRVNKLSNVRFLPKHDALGLVTTPDHTAVTGIQVRDRGQSGQTKTLTADLVVDASGRSSKLAAWLEGLGYDVPKPDILKANLGYSTRRYQVPSRANHLTEKWDVINIAAQPVNGTSAGVFSFIENNVAELLLYHPGGQFPPASAEEYERAVAQLPSPLIAGILQELEPITAPKSFRVPELYRNRYEKMHLWPSGLLVLGDAFCIYDPIFGQGMTVATMEAEALYSGLAGQKNTPQPDFEQSMLQNFQDVIEPAWWLNCATDLQWEGIEYTASFEPLKGISFGRKYMDLHLKYATEEQNFKLYGLYWAVNTLSLSPREMLNPHIVTAVLSASEEGRQLLDELLRQNGGALEQTLDEILPSFSGIPVNTTMA
ncbi:FAD-dependent monooxygenase [Paenibacillus macerans]|uniref:NAD(P)/FAD-dependent oxidoreductase n=1 Tax=Paenibacillus macerans TaxID=44252 RepID=UPI002E20174F|nr:FAD-dependent monooxygenase [Paenibacillus macerans]MED4956110.1 FAD-dependent monooxygenase [Paenibacillus macerans]